ncbi:hypothetical protein D7Y13_02150 [Corallococcus praedator]|uniref:Uncharacterized protein n=1 Tax=Corallococcus praedator TaxID=2316724 RepID=A0ABX9QQL2_9BACT|nr:MULTISPECIES: hypothetical protein [Corallococcus]RKH34835.1 hypothetical protein D7X75_06470 [Corallococcus sp. CA031C]RKI16762.1 hypothetical protein D7Y13_02150 [Corallococcus praedator]
MSGEGTQPVAAVLVKMMDFRVGRVLLWTVSVLLGLLGLVPGPASGDILRVAALLGVLAAAGSFKAWRDEGGRFGPSFGLLPRLAFGAVLFGAAALLVWWRRRRDPKSAAAALSPPSAEEVDRWATAELAQEQAR